MEYNISVVIPNFNGLELLKTNLPKVISSTLNYDKNAEFILVDDASQDNSVSYVKKEFNFIKVIKHSVNRGFSSSVNIGIKNSTGDFVVLLNNDVLPSENYLNSAVKLLTDKKVFAVSFCESGYSWAKGYFRDGFVGHEPGGFNNITHDTFWVNGGSGIFKRNLLRKLGGFDEELFNPFYWEDVDLSYRALKRGYKLLWDPDAKVIHNHGSTINLISKKKKELIRERNQLLFIWKNITSNALIKRHFKGLYQKLSRHPGYIKVVIAAGLKYRICLKRRKIEIKESKVCDEVIFAGFK